LPVIEEWRPSGPVLQRTPFGNSPDIMALHYASGCGHQCPFCPVGGQPSATAVRLMSNAAERLHEELSRSILLPRAVHMCPHSDPFPPLLAVQEETARVVEVLAQHSVQSWLMTRGYIRPFVLDILARHRTRVKIVMGLTTLDRQLQRVLEPLSAPPRLRLRQLRQLNTLGIPVQVALEPLVPELTDTREQFLAVLEALAEARVKRVIAGYLYLAPGAQERLQQVLHPLGYDAVVLDTYADGFERHQGEYGRVRFLSRSRRQQGYARLMALAARFGITVSISAASNPDFARPEPKRVFAQGYLPGLGHVEKIGSR
jgi:DNA repair photolyase